MSGIAGFIASSPERPDPSVLERMTRSLQRQGGDAWGYYVDDRFGFGVARPYMPALESGDRPVTNGDGSVHVVLDGEIYNVADVRDSLTRRGHLFETAGDSEVVAHAWEEYGDQCLRRFNGVFALAIWDERREELFLARDRRGKKRLYSAVAKGWLIFGSELPAVLVHPAVDRELELATVSRSLGFDVVPESQSMICGVSKLPPAHFLTASNGKLTVQSYLDVVSTA